MKPYTIQDSHDQVVDDENTTRLSINADVMNVIMSALTNMYSSPESAVVREYLANAIDAHRASNVDQPVILTLPTYTFPLVIQDFGAGLSSEAILALFSGYGQSLKRENNNLIGGFGLGSKSALAITDMFNISSIHEGVKTDAIVGKSPSGGGYVRVESTERTTEPSGTTVTINFHSGEGRTSQSTDSYLTEDVRNLLFRGYGPGELTVKRYSAGGDHLTILRESIRDEGMVEVTDGMGTVLGWFRDPSHKSYNLYHGNKLFFVIGGVVYESGRDPYTRKSPLGLDSFPALEIHLNIPIGGMELVPSRESIIASARSKQAAKSIYDQFITVLNGKMREEVNSAPDHAAALLVRDSWSAAKMETSGLTWKGEIIPTEFIYSNLIDGTIQRAKKKVKGVPATSETDHKDSGSLHLPNSTSAWRKGLSRTVVILDKKLTVEALKRSTATLLKSADDDVQISYTSKKSDNVWFNSLTEYLTADEYRDRLRVIRDRTPRAKKVTGDFYFVINVDKADSMSTRTVVSESVEKINEHSEVYYIGGDQERRLVSGLTYLKPEGSPKTRSSYSIYLKPEVRELLERRLDGKTIVLLSSTSKVDKFKALTPDVKHIPLTQTLFDDIRADLERTATASVDHSSLTSAFRYQGEFSSVTPWLNNLPEDMIPALPKVMKELLDLKRLGEEPKEKATRSDLEQEHDKYIRDLMALGKAWSNPQVVQYDTTPVHARLQEFYKINPLFQLTSPRKYSRDYYEAMFTYFECE